MAAHARRSLAGALGTLRKKMRTKLALSLFVVIASIGCVHRQQASDSASGNDQVLTGVLSGAWEPANPTPAPALPRGQYDGFYIEGFETHFLVACGSTEQWVVYGAESQLQAFRAANSALLDSHGDFANSVYARVIGTPSATGNYGHLGSYPRRLDVDEFVEVREPREGDCAPRPGA